MSERVLFTTSGCVATVTLSRPSKRNALTMSMWRELAEVVTAIDRSSVRVIVLRGDGEAFSAGADLKEVNAATTSRKAAEDYCHTIVGALKAWSDCPIPTVAVLDGVASGGGAELAVTADVRVANRSARFQLPMAALGVVPDALTLRNLQEVVGLRRARWLLLKGHSVDAETCLRIGLVDEVYDDGCLESGLAELLQLMQLAPPDVSQRIKKLLMDSYNSAADCIANDAKEMVASFTTGAVAEASMRFLNRRPS